MRGSRTSAFRHALHAWISRGHAVCPFDKTSKGRAGTSSGDDCDTDSGAEN
jgi:hypothetical protein